MVSGTGVDRFISLIGEENMKLVRTIDRIAQGKATRREIGEIAALAGIVPLAVPVIARPAVASRATT